MSQVLYILLGFFASLGVNFVIGQLLLRRLNIQLFRQEQPAIAIILGCSVWSLGMFLLAAAHLIHKGVLVGLAAAVMIIGWKFKAFVLPTQSFPPLPKTWKYVLGIIAAVFGVLYISNAMAPEISPDGMAYHLGLTTRYYREHGFHPITTNMYASLSQAMEMLFLLPYSIGRHPAAAMTHMIFLWLLPWMILCFGRRNGFVNAGALAAVLIFCAPVIGVDGISAYNDLATASAIFTVFYLVQLWKQQRQASLITAIGITAGFAFALKYTAFLALPYAVVTIIKELHRDRKPWHLPAAKVVAIASIFILPWMIKNTLFVGNPVSPFLNSVFPNHNIHIWFEASYKRNMSRYGMENLAWIPVETTIRGDKLGGLLGPMFVLLPLGLLGFRKRAARPLILAALLFTLPYPANIGTRFLIPSAPFWALSFAILLESIPHLALALALIHAALSWPDAIPLYSAKYTWRLNRIPWKSSLHIVDDDYYIGRNVGGYAMTREIERVVPIDKTVFGFDQIQEAYAKPKFMVSFQSAHGEIITDIFHSALMPSYLSTGRTTFNFPSQKLTRIRLVQTGNLPSEKWSMAEFRLFSQKSEVQRLPSWKLRSAPNSWDVQMAFDNSPVTRWSSWEPKRPGMFIEIQFPSPQLVDQVVLEVSRDQTPGYMALEGYDQYGNKYQLSNTPKESLVEAPEGWRLLSTRAMMARGIDYFLISETNYGYQDVKKNARYWGMELIAVKGTSRLYKLTGNTP